MKPKENRAADPSKSSAMDRCQTPSYALGPLLPYIKPNWIVWESAVGEGYLKTALDPHVKQVIGSDVLTGNNFYEWEPEAWDVQITNPPYSSKYRWMRRSYLLKKPFALLLPVESIGTKTALLMMRDFGFEIILFFPRVDFKMPNAGWEGSSAQFPVMWFTWGFNIGQQITIAELDKPKKQRKPKKKDTPKLLKVTSEVAIAMNDTIQKGTLL